MLCKIFAVFAAVTTKNAIFLDVGLSCFCKERRFVGTYRLHRQGDVFLHSLLRLLVIANVGPSSSILVTLTMEAIRSSEMSILRRATRRNNPRRLHSIYITPFTILLSTVHTSTYAVVSFSLLMKF
jgi:hypothetical protein